MSPRIHNAVVKLFPFAVAPSAEPSIAPTATPTTLPVAFTQYGQYEYTIPAGLTSVNVIVTGASGSSDTCYSASNVGGFGAIVQATIVVTPGQLLYIFVGQRGGCGGAGAGGGSGGGGTDIRTSPDISSRIIVAGGGGGGRYVDPPGRYQGGNGGTPDAPVAPPVEGGTPACHPQIYATGGSQTAGGAPSTCSGHVSGLAGTLAAVAAAEVAIMAAEEAQPAMELA
eukprot:gene20544-21202_t